MISRNDFASRLSKLKPKLLEMAIAYLWYYRHFQQFEDRTARELADDFHQDGFSRPNLSRLSRGLKQSRKVVVGKRKHSFQINSRHLDEIDGKHRELIGAKLLDIGEGVINAALVAGTRPYLEQLVYQINGTYELGFYDGCAVLSRRLMEMLIIEVYIFRGRQSEIRVTGSFYMLEKLIAHIVADDSVVLSRGASKAMGDVKRLGDSSAHNRTFIASKTDIDDIKHGYRILIPELLSLAGIEPKRA